MEEKRPETDEQAPNEDPQTGDSNESADDKVDIQQPDGSTAPRAE